ncbi:MAG: hypothetical protein B6242_02535 [Anaerolineaceae bacterium 4572_78]|nr:MAG: hypothetical protein B6242_02535 [Anaerolineaceae bacterium 4572_78]
MHKNPERIAWTVMLFSCLGCCLFTISLPSSIAWYIANAIAPHTVTVTSAQGTVLAKKLRDEFSTPVTHGTSLAVNEWTLVSTDNSAQAVVTFFDGNSITLYNNTSVVIQKIEDYRFNNLLHILGYRFRLSPYLDAVEILVVRGRIRATILEANAERTFLVRTLHSETNIIPGSYAVESDINQTQITARLGQADVHAQNETVILKTGQRSTIFADQPPSEAMVAEQNLIRNSDFNSQLDGTWEIDSFVHSEIVTTTVNITSSTGRSVLHFYSHGVDNIHAEISVLQWIDKDVRDFQSLHINADIRLIYQSLQGGGSIGSEFPMMIHLAYKDANGNDRDWHHGFYYEPPLENYILYNQANNSSENITRFLWYPYESENLLETLDNSKPVYIRYIRLYASGWIYEIMVDDVKLLAQD